MLPTAMGKAHSYSVIIVLSVPSSGVLNGRGGGGHGE